MEETLHSSIQNGTISDEIRDALAHLVTEVRSALPARPSQSEYRIKLAAAMLVQAEEMIAQYQTAISRGGLAPWQARRAEAMIDKNLGTKLSVGALAEAVRLSPSHFRRAFRHTFGVAPHGYILRRRVDRAKELMQTTNDALADIALACGLADQSHFSTVFRRIECESPNAWRRRRYPPPVTLTARSSKSQNEVLLPTGRHRGSGC
jgi:AraC family transcriptional regulator